MSEEKQFRIAIPESIEGYKITLFWGLTIKQIVLVFIALLFMGFGIYNLAAGHILSAFAMVIIACFSLLGIIEIQGRNFYKHLLFIFLYYKTKPQALVYSHKSVSAKPEQAMKQLVYESKSNKKVYMFIILGLSIGLTLLILTSIYIYHVVHK